MRSFDLVPMRVARRVAGGSVAALALLALSGCQKPAAKAAPPAPTVGVVESRRMSVPVVVTPNGTTRALEDVTIRARVRGFLTERHFEEGAIVKKGQLLLVIDEEPYKVALQSARARQAEAEAALKKAEESKGREVAAAQLELDRAQLAARPDPGAAEPGAAVPQRRVGRGPRQGRGRPQAVGGAGRGRPGQPRAGEGRLRRRDRRGPGPGRGRQGRRPRRRAEPGLLPDVRPDRRPDRRGPGQGRQPRRAGRGRRRRLHRAGHDPAARPDGRRHPAQLPRPRPGHRADRAGAGRPPHPPRARRATQEHPYEGRVLLHRQHDRRDDLDLPGQGRGPQPRRHAPARRVRQGRGWSSTGSRTPSSSPRRPSIETEAGPIVYVVDEQGKVAVQRVDARPDLRGAAGHHQGPRPGRPGDRRGAADDPPGPAGQDRAGRRSPGRPDAARSRRGPDRAESTDGRSRRRDARREVADAAARTARRSPRRSRSDPSTREPDGHGQLLHPPADLRHRPGPADAARSAGSASFLLPIAQYPADRRRPRSR